MRFAKPITWLLWCGLLVFCASGARAEQTRAPGHIIAVKVQGAVYATNLADQSQVALTEKAILTQQYVVTTGANSSVILLFSNGSTINLGADSTLSIDEFLQDPFADNLAMDQLTEEPTTSVTKITLTRGELVGNVKRIKEEAGSSFTVNTPVGAAGIRGTIFRIVFRPDASGQAFFTLSTAEGRVVYEAPAAAGVPVVTGSEVVVSVDVTVDAATGTVTLTAPPVVAAVQEIPPATQAAIAVAAQEIVEAAAAAIISSTDQAAADKAAADKEAADKAAAEKAAAEKEAAEKEAAEKAAQEKEAQEKEAAEKAAQEKAAQEKAAEEKAAQEKAAQEKAAQEKAAQEEPQQPPQEQQEQPQPPQEQPQQDQPPPQPPAQPPAPLPPPTTPPSNTTPGDGL